MSITMSLDDAQSRLKELIHRLAPGDEVILTENEQPVAKLVGQAAPPPKPPRPEPGWGRDMILDIAPDFDAPLEEMKEYME